MLSKATSAKIIALSCSVAAGSLASAQAAVDPSPSSDLTPREGAPREAAEPKATLPTVLKMLEAPEMAYLADAMRDVGMDQTKNLSDERMPVTLLVPSPKVWEHPEVARLREPGNEAELRDFLRKHIVFGDLTRRLFGKGKSYLTQLKKPGAGEREIRFESVRASVDNEGHLRIGGARITETTMASNGRIYMIDGMLSLDDKPGRSQDQRPGRQTTPYRANEFISCISHASIQRTISLLIHSTRSYNVNLELASMRIFMPSPTLCADSAVLINNHSFWSDHPEDL